MNASHSVLALGALSVSLFSLACSGSPDSEPTDTGASQGELRGVVSPRDPASGATTPSVGADDPGSPSTGGQCVQTVFCTANAHFDQTVCACVPNGPSTGGGCVERFACTAFDHWDEALCKCVGGPSTPGVGGTPSGPSNPHTGGGPSTGGGKQCIKAPCL